MTKEDMERIGLPLEVESQSELLLASGMEWLKEHTTLPISSCDMEGMEALPPSAKLFLVRFHDIMKESPMVTGESIAGASQSFNTASKDAMIWDIASQILGSCLKGRVLTAPKQKRWRYRGWVE